MRRLTRTSSTRGNPSGAQAGTAFVNPQAMSTPSAPPMRPTAALSVSICLARRPAPAPSAALTASSRARAVPLANSRFATFAHATSRYKPDCCHQNKKRWPDTPRDAVSDPADMHFNRTALPKEHLRGHRALDCPCRGRALGRSLLHAASRRQPRQRRHDSHRPVRRWRQDIGRPQLRIAIGKVERGGATPITSCTRPSI